MAQRRSGSGLILLLVWFAIGSAHLPAAEPTPEDFEFFESHVRPVFLEHCAACHSRQAGEPEGGLSLDSPADFRASEGIALPGRPEESLLVQAVRYDGDLQMPPAGKLPAAAIGVIEEWVRRGLPWPADSAPVVEAVAFDLAQRRAEHWCWQQPRVESPPPVQNIAWCRSEIDQFVLGRLEAAPVARCLHSAPAPAAAAGRTHRRR